jgi:transketolase
MEGVQAEAASLAGHLGLGKLIVLYDDNSITIDGSTALAFSEDVPARFDAYGWDTSLVEDGTDIAAIDRAISAAKAASDKPSLIAVRTRIGYGSPNRENTSRAHGEPLGDDELALTKQSLGWTADERFHIPSEALAHFREALDEGAAAEGEWQAQWDAYAAAYPDLAAELQRRTAGDLPASWDDDLPQFAVADGPLATRGASGKVLNAIAARVPELMGGSADLAGSNKTRIEADEDFGRDNRGGRNLNFGIREHAMGAIMNGMALHRGLRPYGGTFLIFSDYMRPAIRLAALMQVPAIYVFTHDSIAVGEDGPTHQPIEQIASLRAIPELMVIRPSDANETREAWAVAMREPGPVALMLTRQKVPVLGGDAAALGRGAYVLQDAAGDGVTDVILIATGSEVHVAAEAADVLDAEGVRARVVSMPSWELFERQDQAYRDQVLPPLVTARVSVEAGVTFGWHRHVGDAGTSVGIDRFGASAPGSENLRQFGFTVENVADAARAVCGR